MTATQDLTQNSGHAPNAGAAFTHAVAGGIHVIAAEQQPSFWSRTLEGGRNGSRIDHPDAFSCRVSNNSMKTIVATGFAAHGAADGAAVEGGVHGVFAQPVGQDFELIPETDPTLLRRGDHLRLRRLFRGEPWQGEVVATWEGYAPRNDDDYPVTLRTDAEGRVALALMHAGGWLVRANVQEPHSQPEICDHQAWNASFSFEVQ